MKSPEEGRVSKGQILTKAERYLERALYHFKKKRYEEALSDLDEAIAQESRNPELYATRGYVIIEAGYDEAEAEADFEQALKIDPSQWIVYYARGVLAFRRGDYDAALQQFAEAQRISPLRPELFTYRSAAFYLKGDVKSAEREIDSAMQVIQPKDKRGTQARRWRKAIRKLRKKS